MAGWPVAGWPGGRVAGWPGGRMAGWPDGRVAGWPDGRMAGWPGGRVAGWPGGRAHKKSIVITWHVRKKQLFVGPTPLNIYVFVKLDTFPQGLSEHKTNMKPPSTNV